MNWFIILIYSITAYGLSNIIINANGPWHLFDKWHKWAEEHSPMMGELFSCFMCFPTWIGIIASVCNMLILPSLPITPFNIIIANKALWPIIVFADAFYTSGIVWLINTWQTSMEKYMDE